MDGFVLFTNNLRWNLGVCDGGERGGGVEQTRRCDPDVSLAHPGSLCVLV